MFHYNTQGARVYLAEIGEIRITSLPSDTLRDHWKARSFFGTVQVLGEKAILSLHSPAQRRGEFGYIPT